MDEPFSRLKTSERKPMNKAILLSILLAPFFPIALCCRASRDAARANGAAPDNPSGSQIMQNKPETNKEAQGAGGKLVLSDEEWKKRLTPEQYSVCRRKGTERAFTGKYWNSKKEGAYVCAACGNELFSSRTKFDSGTGWPSFWEPVSKDKVDLEEDNSLFSTRTEVRCARCDAHLGHVFDDGPEPTHQRYCINSVALDLVEKKEK